MAVPERVMWKLPLRLHCWPGVCFRFRFFNSSKSFIHFWTALTWGPSLCQCAALLSAGVSGGCCGLNPLCFALCKDASFSLPGQHLLSFLPLPPDSISEVHPGNPTSTEGLQAWQRGGLRWVQLMGRSGWKRRQRERSSAGQKRAIIWHRVLTFPWREQPVFIREAWRLRLGSPNGISLRK